MFTYVFADALVQCGGTAAGTGSTARFKEICPRCWSSSRAPDQLERLCVGVTRLHRILPGAHHKAPQARGGCAGASAPASRRDSGPSRTRRRDCSRQGPLCSASDLSTPHTACAGRPAADSAGPATAARPGRTAGTHAPHKGVPGKSASATRTFAGSPVSCCTAFQRRSVTRLRRQQRQARLNRKAGRPRRSSAESTRKMPGMEAFRFLYKNKIQGPSTGAESTRRLPTRDGSI